MPPKRVMQLAHISDVHFGPPREGGSAEARGSVEALEGLIGRLVVDKVQQGLSGHDPDALHHLRDSIVKNANPKG